MLSVRLGPQGSEEQADGDAHGDFDEAVKRHDPSSAVVCDEYDNGKGDARKPVSASIHAQRHAEKSRQEYRDHKRQDVGAKISGHEAA